MSAPLDRIVLTGLRARGHHGVYEHERREGQTFVIDLVVHLDLARAAGSDDVADTVHYGELAEAVVGAVERDPVDLIETLAARLVDLCMEHPLVDAAHVTVHKPSAPVGVPFGDVAVTFGRMRAW